MDPTLTFITENILFYPILFGIIGAIIRISVDYSREMIFKKKAKKDGFLFYFTSVIVIGAFMGVVLNYKWELGVLGGFFGINLLSILYSAITKVKITVKGKSR